MFADDCFGSWVFRSPDAFRQAIRSVEKTVILKASSGTSASSVIGGYKRVIDGETFLQIPVGLPALNSFARRYAGNSG